MNSLPPSQPDNGVCKPQVSLLVLFWLHQKSENRFAQIIYTQFCKLKDIFWMKWVIIWRDCVRIQEFRQLHQISSWPMPHLCESFCPGQFGFQFVQQLIRRLVLPDYLRSLMSGFLSGSGIHITSGFLLSHSDKLVSKIYVLIFTSDPLPRTF